MYWVLAQEVLCMCGTVSHKHPWESRLISKSTEILKRLKRKSKLQLKTLWPRRRFRVHGLLQLLSSLLRNLRLQTSLKAGRCPLCLQQFPSEDWSTRLTLKTGLQPPLCRPPNGWGQPPHVLRLFFHKLLNKMEIRLMKNKQLMENKQLKKKSNNDRSSGKSHE